MSKKRKNPLLSRDLSLILNNFPEENVYLRTKYYNDRLDNRRIIVIKVFCNKVVYV
jgi:hypothetical protein